jgi:hypothetical protein
MSDLGANLTDLLKQLIGAFLLLRDLFGYLVPGLVFAALLFSDELKAFASASPNWLEIVLTLLGSYAAGHVLAGIGYSLHGFAAYWAEAVRTGTVLPPDKVAQTKSEADALFYRYRFPAIFVEYDRQDTMHILRIALAMGLILAGLVHLNAIWPASGGGMVWSWRLVLLLGVFLLYNSYGGRAHMQVIKDASVKAATMADDAKMTPVPEKKK